MRHTVVWFPAAQQRLTEIWLAEPDRPAVTAEADEIDRLLRTDPLEIGQVRTALVRFLAEYPLAVYYVVREQDMIVEVRAIWRLPE